MIANDAQTTDSESAISDQIFNNGNGAHNLQSQYSACSYDQLNFVKTQQFPNIIGNDGVHTLTISNDVIGLADGTVRNAVTAAGDDEFGTLSDAADYVMLCLPPGTSGGWIAYAYVNHWLSVYNDKWCGYISGQMHEIGKFISSNPSLQLNAVLTFFRSNIQVIISIWPMLDTRVRFMAISLV